MASIFIRRFALQARTAVAVRVEYPCAKQGGGAVPQVMKNGNVAADAVSRQNWSPGLPDRPAARRSRQARCFAGSSGFGSD